MNKSEKAVRSADSQSHILRCADVSKSTRPPPAASIPQQSHQSDVMLFLLLFSPTVFFLAV